MKHIVVIAFKLRNKKIKLNQCKAASSKRSKFVRLCSESDVVLLVLFTKYI